MGCLFSYLRLPQQCLSARKAPLRTPSDIDPQAVKEISGALNALLADVFSVSLKTKNFHSHMSGPLFRDYHLLLDDHADQIFVMTDDIAEHVRKIGGTTIRSIGEPPAQRTWPLPTVATQAKCRPRPPASNNGRAKMAHRLTQEPFSWKFLGAASPLVSTKCSSAASL